MPCRSIYSGWRQKSSLAPVEPMVKKNKHRCNESPLFQRACLVDSNFSSAPVEPTVQKSKHRCIRSPMFQRACLDWSVKLFSTGWTDAPTEHAPVHWSKPGHCVRTPTATIWTQRDRLNRRLKSDTHRFFRCSRFFLQWTSNGYVTLSTIYKGTPWLI